MTDRDVLHDNLSKQIDGPGLALVEEAYNTELQQLLKKIDKDKDGKLSKDELDASTKDTSLGTLNVQCLQLLRDDFDSLRTLGSDKSTSSSDLDSTDLSALAKKLASCSFDKDWAQKVIIHGSGTKWTL